MALFLPSLTAQGTSKNHLFVIPVQARIHEINKIDSRFRGNDG